MPTVYKLEILNHLVDGYEEAQRKVVGAERHLAVATHEERAAWDRYEDERGSAWFSSCLSG